LAAATAVASPGCSDQCHSTGDGPLTRSVHRIKREAQRIADGSSASGSRFDCAVSPAERSDGRSPDASPQSRSGERKIFAPSGERRCRTIVRRKPTRSRRGSKARPEHIEGPVCCT
jgi:hypothetical protein